LRRRLHRADAESRARRERCLINAADARSPKNFMRQLCQACECAAVDVTDPCDDPEAPYELCRPCRHRLHALALRPLEWYNLAKRHGWYQFLLHDDFYDENGEAGQPKEDVENAREFPAPTLEKVASDPEALLNYSITRWRLREDTVTAWRALPASAVLAKVIERFASTANAGIRGRILEICGSVLGAGAADLVRYAWGDYPGTVALAPLARASAACLPEPEGFDRVESALELLPPKEQRERMYCLEIFHSAKTLDWIESHVFSPVTDAWGYLAADSRLDWPRVTRWLEAGRPLSRVALNALSAIVRDRPAGAYVPHLHSPPSETELRETLRKYAERDPVPAVHFQTNHLLANASRLLRGPNPS
jgi:hypothetical protein